MNESIPLLHATHLRLQGPDAERYLNGQITQQVTGLLAGQSRATFICDGKGRILFDATVYHDEEGYLLSVDGGNGEELFNRIDRYLIADDCQLSDESDRWGILHHLGQETTSPINRFGSPGQDQYLTGEALAELTPLSLEKQAELTSRRIKAGVPSLADLVGALPAETGWEEQAVSYHKGCYLGQEVISRMKRAGKTNRTLSPVTLSQHPSQLPLNFTSPGSEKTLLTVTSVASIAEGTEFPALGYLSSKAKVGELLESQDGIQTTI